jgi:LmbE family N-acetylglucosaminyl deacetylase
MDHPPSPAHLVVGPGDRIMVLSPHPDDESLPIGGTLARAAARGASVRVVYATDGDNNPWAQRAVERRWHIGPEDRTRWARRRRDEALCALRTLGVPESAAAFLGWPDQGLTGLLTAGDPGPVDALTEAIDGWRPTMLLVPGEGDHHPDHSSLAVLSHFALARLAEGARPAAVLRYEVHVARRAGRPGARRILLAPEELEAKRKAILCHSSQLRLRRRFMLDFAQPAEEYHDGPGPEESSPGHPVPRTRWENRTLVLDVVPPRFEPGPVALLVAFGGGSRRCFEIRVPRGSGEAPVSDLALGLAVGVARCRRGPGGVVIGFEPGAADADLRAGAPWVKLDLPARRRMGFFDRAGWRLGLPSPAAVCASEEAPSGAPISRRALTIPD